jgi:uncharacterized protein YbaR (Trm112 family)
MKGENNMEHLKCPNCDNIDPAEILVLPCPAEDDFLFCTQCGHVYQIKE